MLNQPRFNSKSHILGHHNHFTSPKSVSPATPIVRQSPTIYTPMATQNIQSQIVQGTQQGEIQTQIKVMQTSNLAANRVSQSSTQIIKAFLVSSGGERQCDFKTVGEQCIRIKDIASQFCYKFRVSISLPVVQLHQNDSLRLFLTFSGDYVSDLHKFIASIKDARFNFGQNEKQVSFEFRFQNVELKSQLIELFKTIRSRTSLNLVQNATHLISNRSLSSIANNQIRETSPVIQTFHQAHPFQRSYQQQFRHPNQQLVGQVPISPLIQTPIIQQTTTQTIQTIQRVVQPEVESVANQLDSSKSRETTEILRLTDQNKILNSTILSIQQDHQAILQKNSRLEVQVQSLKRQIQLLKSDTTIKNNDNEGETIRLKAEMVQLSQSLSAAERRISDLQIEVNQSKNAETLARSQKQSLKINFMKQISQLETKINIINSTPISNSTETSNHQHQLDLQKYQGEISRLTQILNRVEVNLVQSEQRNEQLLIEFEAERLNLNRAVEQRSFHIQYLQQQLFESQQRAASEVRSTNIQNTAEFSSSLEVERQRFLQEYQILQAQRDRQVHELTMRIQQIAAEDGRKFAYIQQLENQLNNFIHIQDISRNNTNLEAIEKTRAYYEDQIANNKAVYQNEFRQINDEIQYYQRIAQEYQQKYGNLLDEFQAFSNSQKVFNDDSVTTSQNLNQVRLTNKIIELQREREFLIRRIDELSRRQPEVTYTTIQQGGDAQGTESNVVETVTYGLQGNNQIVQKVTYRTENQPQTFVQTQTIERITTEAQTGQQQLESIERVTYQQNQGYEQTQITTYEINDGEQRYIHRVTTDSVEGKMVHQVDTNILVHQQQGEVTYDIETQETNYGNNNRAIEYNQYGQVSSSSASNNVSSSQAEVSGSGVVGGQYRVYGGNQNVIYHGGNVNVHYGSNGRNIVIEGGDYAINIPGSGVRNISVSEESYRR